MWKIITPPQVTRWNIQNHALKKRHAPSFSKNFTLHENIKICRLKQRPRNLPENFNSEFKPMIEICERTYTKGESKQSKGQ